MLAYQLTAWQQPAELREVPIPEPGPGEILIKVAAAGACHSDLHLMEWPEGTLPYALPFTLGHENTGWVEGLGVGVSGLEIGEPVAIYGPWGCGRCPSCRVSKENYCLRQMEMGTNGGGLGLDGGMAEFMLVPASRLLLPLLGLDPVQAAPLTDAGLTPYHAIKRSLHLLTPGAAAVVIGVGGLGHMAVQLLDVLGPARLIAVDTSEQKLDLAREVGADHAFLSGDAAEGIRDLTGATGAQLVLDMVGADDTLALGSQIVAGEGHLTVIGLAGGTLDFGFGGLPWESQLTLTYWGSAAELGEVIELARSGAIRAHVERFPLDRVDEAYERMRDGTLAGRAVICPHD